MEVKLLDRVRQAIRLRHYSRRTEEAYVALDSAVHRVSRQAPSAGARASERSTAYLSSLAARGVSASTQNQALSAVLFLFEVVLGSGWRVDERDRPGAAARSACRSCCPAPKCRRCSRGCAGRCG